MYTHVKHSLICTKVSDAIDILGIHGHAEGVHFSAFHIRPCHQFPSHHNIVVIHRNTALNSLACVSHDHVQPRISYIDVDPLSFQLLNNLLNS